MKALFSRYGAKASLAAAFMATMTTAALAMPATPSKDPANKRSQAAYMRASEPVLAPMGWVMFCMQNGDQCRGSSEETIALTPERLATLRSVNLAVNRSIRPSNVDPVTHRWSVAPTSGNCNDFAVTKRAQLARLGFSTGALRMAIARTSWGEGHAVLVVRTDKGDLVLDSLRNVILPWNATGLRWISVQSATNPGVWYRT